MELNVQVKDLTGDRCQRVRLPAGATIGQVRPQIVETLCLPENDFDGQPITWVLYNESVETMPVLSDVERVGDALQDEQVVRVIPNVIAGVADHV